MKIITITLLFSLYSLGQNIPACGRAVTVAEMTVLKQEMSESYSYDESDSDTQANVMTDVMGLYDDNYIFEMFFFMKDRNRIGMKIVGSFNDEIKERISCYLLSAKTKGIPANRFLLFYDVKSKVLVYSITNAK